MITINGNIIHVKHGFVCHQVNCQGVMGAGLAASIKAVWPKVYNDYMAAYERSELNLGEVVFTSVKTGHLYVASICGQHSFGWAGLHTDYDALKLGFQRVKDWYKVVGEGKLPVYIPHKIGCGLGGGDWSRVSEIIKQKLPDAIIIKLAR